MQMANLFPRIVNVTDLRYRWPKVVKEFEESDWPVLIVEHSTPKAVIVSFEMAKKLWGSEKVALDQKDSLTAWRKKYAHQFSGWNATRVIRKGRDSRWNLS